MTLQTARQGGLERGVNGKDALKWIETAKVVLNGQIVDIPIPIASAGATRFVRIEPVNVTQEGYKYNIVYYEGQRELIAKKGYTMLGEGRRGLQPNRIYALPDYVRQLHIGTR